jgi:predicted O-methyltransferase YrrM
MLKRIHAPTMRSSINPWLDHIYATGTLEDADGKIYEVFPTGISWEVGEALYRLVRAHQFTRTLEVGLAYGLSAMFIAQALRDMGGGAHCAIDPFQLARYHNLGLANLKRAGLDDLVTGYPEFSFAVLPRLVAAGAQLDFAFVDGSHKFDYVMVDWFYLNRLLRVGGYIVFDDLWMPSVRRAIAFVLRNCAYRLVPIPASTPWWLRAGRIARRLWQTPCGSVPALTFLPHNIAVLEKMGEDTRPFDFHREF